MNSFTRAIKYDFYNGHAASFCQELSFLSAMDLCQRRYGENGKRDTFTDGFKLVREPIEKMKSPSKKTRNESLIMGANSKSSSTSDAYGKCTADFMVMSALLQPLIIFECKSDASSFNKGIIQLISHGLALWDKKRVKHKIKLVLLTPRIWCTASLPSFDEFSV